MTKFTIELGEHNMFVPLSSADKKGRGIWTYKSKIRISHNVSSKPIEQAKVRKVLSHELEGHHHLSINPRGSNKKLREYSIRNYQIEARFEPKGTEFRGLVRIKPGRRASEEPPKKRKEFEDSKYMGRYKGTVQQFLKDQKAYQKEWEEFHLRKRKIRDLDVELKTSLKEAYPQIESDILGKLARKSGLIKVEGKLLGGKRVFRLKKKKIQIKSAGKVSKKKHKKRGSK